MLSEIDKSNSITKMEQLLALLLVALILLFLVIIFAFNQQKKNFAAEDWAFQNNGQIISNVKGEKGVDINLDITNKMIEGKNIIVAVVDTGIDPSCSILKKNFLKDRNNRLIGYDFYNDKKDIYTKYLYDYHGTYIATTIVRVAPKIKILPVKFMSGSSGNSEDAIKSLQYAIENGANIINCSWNMEKNNKRLHNIIKSNPDILFVCSAGNNYLDLDKHPLFPCSYDLDNIISVMGIDNQGNIFDDSGYGRSVNIAAPGKQVHVILPENDTDFVDGSSVSAAFVSGAAALMLSKNSNLTPKEIIRILEKTVRKLPQLKGKCQAEGILDIKTALSYIRNSKKVSKHY